MFLCNRLKRCGNEDSRSQNQDTTSHGLCRSNPSTYFRLVLLDREVEKLVIMD
jgi:hypothetical protein